MHCLQIQGIGHLISKKYRDLNECFNETFNPPPISPKILTSAS
jgi:hypothetical protein